MAVAGPIFLLQNHGVSECAYAIFGMVAALNWSRAVLMRFTSKGVDETKAKN